MANDTDMVKANNATVFFNTLSTTDTAGKVAAFNAINAAKSLNDFVGVSLNIVNAITMPGTRKSLDGDSYTDCQNTYLIDNEGQAYFSQSAGVARAVNTMHDMFPDFNAPDGINITCIENKLTNGRKFKTLQID